MAISNTYEWNNNGIQQSDRLPKALSSEYVKIDERSFDDILAQMAEYAKRLTYFDNDLNPNGDWTAFFQDVYDYKKHELKKDRIEALTEAGDVPPHMALIMAFIKLFQIEQSNLNTLTEKHLNFYYKDILGFKPKIGNNGNATVFFESAKSISGAFVPKGTVFDAGKDADGKPVTFRSVRDVTVNQAKVEEYKRYSESLNNQEPFELVITSSLLTDIEGGVTLYDSAKKNILSKTNFKPKLIDGAVHIKVTDQYQKLGTIIERFDHLTISVKGSTNFTMENPQGALANQTGTMPFGAQPQKGDSFKIYIPNADNVSSAEVKMNCNHFKDSEFKIDKKKLPISITFNGNLDWATYTDNLKQFIEELKGEDDPTIDWTVIGKALEECKQLLKEASNKKWTSPYYKITLYLKKLENYIMQLKSLANNQNKNSTALPQPPQTPSLAEPITIDYTLTVNKGEASIVFTSPYCNLDIQPGDNNLLPKTESVCMKMQGINTASPITLHFKMNPFNYPSDGKYGEDTASWYYFSSEGWQPFDRNDIMSDTTNRFQQSGIVQLNINEAVAQAATKAGKAGLWLMASDPCNPFVALEGVKAQAVEVELDPTSEGLIPHGTALPAGSITKTKVSIKGIKKVEQPYDGNEGMADESDEKFYCRVSEKLRHKERAWNCWDYERMVLEHFPQVAKVKCLPCRDDNGEMKAGCVTLLVVPDYQAIPQKKPLEPTIGQTLKTEIKNYIKQHSPRFADIYVTEPKYKKVKITCTLVLKKEYTDTEYYSTLLKEQLTQFIAPWSTGAQGVDFKTKQNESHIQEFIENQYYIDHIVSFKCKVDDDWIDSGSTIQPEDAISIITSADDHSINFE